MRRFLSTTALYSSLRSMRHKSIRAHRLRADLHNLLPRHGLRHLVQRLPGHELLCGNADMRAVHEPGVSGHISELLRNTGHGNAILYSLRPHLHSALLSAFVEMASLRKVNTGVMT